MGSSQVQVKAASSSGLDRAGETHFLMAPSPTRLARAGCWQEAPISLQGRWHDDGVMAWQPTCPRCQ